MSDAASVVQLTPKDFASDQEVRWCPGCGNYSILAQTKKALASLGIPREKTVFVSGIGCASRSPYYVGTYGFHGIHGRALGIATGIKLAQPDLSVWVATGDGDALSIGGNHLLHAIRRNMDINILLYNNRTYGLTKGQYSPTSPVGMKTKSTPMGSIDFPLRPLSVAIAAEATFVARSPDMDAAHLEHVIERAARHKGTSFIEIYQNCVIFNDGAFSYAVDKETKKETTIYLEDGKPLVFGRDRDKGIILNGLTPQVVRLGDEFTEKDLLRHDEKMDEPSLAHILARMTYPEFPEPMGVFRCVERPTYEDALLEQIDASVKDRGKGDLEKLFDNGETWTVN